MERRDAFDELGEALGAMVAQDEEAGKQAPVGARGERNRPRYRSEESRLRLTHDVDLEPCVGEALRRLAANPPGAEYGDDPIRLGDLATAALMAGLIEFAAGRLGVEAEWTSHSRGQRRISLVQDFEEAWDRMVLDLGIERFSG